MAWLPDKEMYYVAVHRFPTRDISSRSVISKALNPVLDDAINECMTIWRGLVAQVEEERKRAKSVQS